MSEIKTGSEQPTMVFHAPYPMDPHPTSASRLRPLRMREAFSQLGYRVLDASGTVKQRRAVLKRLRKFLRGGGKVDFLYSENSTQPNLLAGSLKEGVAPLVDYLIMREVARSGAKVGVFYRDIYWKFDLADSTGLYQRVKPLLHGLDMFGYRRNHVHLFVPSMKMASLLDARGLTCTALPPAGDRQQVAPLPQGPLTAVYVGGLGAHYNIESFMQALERTANVELELCTRKDQWEEYVRSHPQLPLSRIRVSHISAGQLANLYERSHIGVLAVDPSPYWEFATPVKLFEYLSYGRPIIATRPTHAAELVEQIGAGWVVDPTPEAIGQMLTHLRDNPQEVAAKAQAVSRAAKDHTWQARALTAANILTGKADNDS
ncbi:MAG: glycosyltransferase [Actinomycetaceae bacterium]|nr:glycosyltransferase [Actinomycetaceae bacterium]